MRFAEACSPFIEKGTAERLRSGLVAKLSAQQDLSMIDTDKDEPKDPKPDTADVDARAFGGHPDHPPQVPDQPADGNDDLLRSKD